MKRRVTADHVRDGKARGLSIPQMMAELGCSRATIHSRLLEAGLVRKQSDITAERREKQRQRDKRHPQHTVEIEDNAAVVEGRTAHPEAVVSAIGATNILVSGANSRKIGDLVTKGRWRGFPIFTLTLEERATCPTTCRNWVSCFGGHMPFAKRIRHDAAFEERLEHELAVLNARYPAGFAIRLHVLGDFYSVAYVELWRQFLARFPALRVFGFSARWDRNDPIAVALVRLTIEQWDRFAMRFSDAPSDECSTITIDHPIQAPADAIICPAQTGKTAGCGTCGFCWNSKRRVAFIRH